MYLCHALVKQQHCHIGLVGVVPRPEPKHLCGDMKCKVQGHYKQTLKNEIGNYKVVRC